MSSKHQEEGRRLSCSLVKGKYFPIVFPCSFELTTTEVLAFLCILVYNFPVSWLLTVFLSFTTKSVVSCFWIKSQDLPFLMDPEGKC